MKKLTRLFILMSLSSSLPHFSSTLRYHTRKCGSSPPPENKNFSGKGKLAVENHSLPPSIYFSKKVEKAVGTQPEKSFLLEKERAHKEVMWRRIKVVWTKRRKHRG